MYIKEGSISLLVGGRLAKQAPRKLGGSMKSSATITAKMCSPDSACKKNEYELRVDLEGNFSQSVVLLIGGRSVEIRKMVSC